MDKQYYNKNKSMAVMLRRFLFSDHPCKTIASLICITKEHFRKYLESQFHSGMSWDNYGKVWSLDHIVPLATFDLNKQEDNQLAWHYLNIRPALKNQNTEKGASIFEAQYELNQRSKFILNNDILNKLLSKVAQSIEQRPKVTYLDVPSQNIPNDAIDNL